MRGWVNRRGRAASPHQRPDRAAAAAQAKVPVPGNSSHHRNGSHSNHPVMQQQSIQQQQQLRGAGRKQMRGTYDTDTESIDTTMPHQSGAQFEARGMQGREELEDDQEDENVDGEDAEFNIEDEEDELDDGEEGTHRHGRQHAQDDRASFQRRMDQIPNMFGATTSYPSTTTGAPEDYPDDDQEPESDVNDQFDESLSSRQQKARGQDAMPGPSRPLTGPPGKPSVFQKGAGIRAQHRQSDSNIARVSTQLRNDPPSSQLPSYSQVPPPSSQEFQNDTRHRQNTRTQNNTTLAQRGPRPFQGPAQVQNTTSTPPPAYGHTAHFRYNQDEEATARGVVPQVILQRSNGHEGEEETFEPDQAPSPIEDYHDGELFTKKYGELKEESFDFAPRAIAPVLSEDMRSKPLDERLEHVQRSLEPADQSKFFRALPTSEWEDAGSWFIDKFSDLIKRNTAARQNKRKIAMEYEAEVEKRYHHVAKKQANVEDAMEKMRTQGAGLVPKSPRRTR